MTSIDWLIEQLDELIPYEGITASQVFTDVIAKAQAMHKAEIIDTYLLDELDSGKKYAEQYYQETFKK